MRRFKAIVTVMAVMAMLVVSSAAPAMAKGNGAVNEERNETPRQQANEENHFNNFNGFNRFGCFNFCGFENENTFSPFVSTGPFFTSFDNDLESCPFWGDTTGIVNEADCFE